MFDLHNHINPVRAISPVSVSDDTPVVSQIIDTRGFGSLEFLILTGAIADADATFSVLVEHGNQDNLSDASAVDDADLLGTELQAAFNYADDNKLRKIGYIGSKRYVRLTLTPSGNSSGALLASLAVQGHPSISPTPNPPV